MNKQRNEMEDKNNGKPNNNSDKIIYQVFCTMKKVRFPRAISTNCIANSMSLYNIIAESEVK